MVEVAPSQSLKPLLKGLQHSNEQICVAAARGLRTLAQAGDPDTVGQTFQPLIEVYRHTAAKPNVRQEIVSALAVVVNNAASALSADQSQAAFSLFEEASKDVRASVRLSAMNTLVKAGRLTPEKTLSAQIEACQSKNQIMCREAAEGIGRTVKIAPKLAEKAIEPLEKLYHAKVSNYEVRQAAIRALITIAVANPHFAATALHIVPEACKDADADVRSTTIKLLEGVAQNAPNEQLARALLKPLQVAYMHEAPDPTVAVNKIYHLSPELAEAASAMLAGAPANLPAPAGICG